ncbi:amidohydrolase family protein [Simiduia curdlanivorans]|uniref:Amidohydrolase family protein n=1 Tax=Simiduia curdlanivorans TaxID=1492769 RepID=A0ABV8V8P6_9GAMM|nr:amidohydrolase family protein [Simiduia curdlanivorans]MDN3639378.1 amidohydrolase family protein [Simiduia curdlanivorans]
MKMTRFQTILKAMLKPVAVVVSGCLCICSSVFAAPDSYVLHNANLIDPYSQSVISNGWLQVTGDSIVALGTGAGPASVQRIDLAGAYLLPGLVDAHMHLTAGPLSVSVENGAPSISMASQEDITRFHALAALASGVTSAFSPAGDPVANQAYAANQRAGLWRGPALSYAGLSFEPTPIVGGTVYPLDPQAWRQEIARQKALGVSHIKLYQGLSEAELRQGIALAHEAGLSSIAHLDQVSWQFAVDAGVDALTHALLPSAELLPAEVRAEYQAGIEPGSSQYLYRWFELVDYDAAPMQKLFASLAAQKVRVDLTLLVNEMMYFYPQLAELYPERRWQQHPAIASTWRQNLGMSVYNWSEQDFARAQAAFPKVLELLVRLHRAGVPLLLGSDSYAGGDWFWRELALHQLAGLDNWHILQMVTSTAARELKLANVGRLETGFFADLVILTTNPLQDISAVETVERVIQRGNIYSIAALRKELDVLSTDSITVKQE